MPTFHVHTHPGATWGVLSRDPDPAGEQIACWYGTPPAPGAQPGARVQHDWTQRVGWRIVGADGRLVLTYIPDEQTAHALLAWLCPAPKE